MKKARFPCIHGSDDKNIDQGKNGRKTYGILWVFRIRMGVKQTTTKIVKQLSKIVKQRTKI